MSDKYLEGFRAVLDVVSRERKYLAMLQAPPLESIRKWIDGVSGKGMSQFVAVSDGKVVGWCDITPKGREGYRHVGQLGMGVLPQCRGQGVGKALMEKTLAAAKADGIEKVELEVHASNQAAIALYERRGFIKEGCLCKARKIDGSYDDEILMGLFFEQP